MKFFIDTAEVSEIKKWADYGFLDGVTTNPSLIAKSGRNFLDVIKEICDLIDSPVSAEVAALDHDTMMKEAEVLKEIAPNVVIKLPTTLDGLKSCRQLTAMGVKTNLTLCFSTNQALLAAKAGATYVSPFIGRLDDINLDGMHLIRDIRRVFDNYGFGTEILAASIRTPNHVSDAAIAGADVATIPAATLEKLAKHPLTDKGLDAFVADWKSTGQSIL
ncbi:fructose-6-phosphate aldolase [Maritalea mediterranea]|uniref:Probable transaldolase n=1 Tax=Maritalea mediterranea TaxID=2909667 RepID=A0ABS9E8F1_9HYPH|nr:fructose-6-phosphate aldolase [Maritalea mediterranea]MCF4098482.1 fructose-6-phosphate aldolase [Maritalea mediterranea]